MTEEEKLSDSLAAWVPPWQRTGSSPRAFEPDALRAPASEPGTPVAAEREEPAEPEPEPEPASEPDAPALVTALEAVPVLELAAALEPEVSIETRADAAGQPPEGGGEQHSDGHDDDYDDVQQPETDSLERPAPPDQPRPDGAPADEPPAGRPADLGPALEAILLVVDEPVQAELLGGVLEAPAAEIEERLRTLADEYDQAKRGFQLRRAAGGWRLYTRGDYAAYVEKFVLDGQSTRLTQAALETLAVVAYQQPVTRSRMAAIRGVNCDGVVRTLMSRGLIEECGTQPESGAHLYRTTQLFLEKLGLDSLEELPSLAPFLPNDVNGLVDAER